MTDTLPNETLRHILARLLDVPDEYFASDAVTLPFARQSDILLVCKRWMRVATSVLYGTAVLQSKAQAQALARAFQMNLSFSGFLKRLRIEGGFGVAVGQIMLAAKNLTELCITLNIHTDDEAICGALPSICPRRLILFGAPSSRATLREALVSAIPLWSQLTRVTLSGSYLGDVSYLTILRSAGRNVELCITAQSLTAVMAHHLSSRLARLPPVRVVRLQQVAQVDD